MQNKESRLIQAAKRTIRAEATLIIVIIVIASWSAYALYKLAVGSDILVNITKSLSSSQNNQSAIEEAKGYDSSIDSTHQRWNNRSLVDSETTYRDQLLQELLSGQRELYASLGHPVPELAQVTSSHRPSSPYDQTIRENPLTTKVSAEYSSNEPNETSLSHHPWKKSRKFESAKSIRSNPRISSVREDSINSSPIDSKESSKQPEALNPQIDYSSGDRDAAESNHDPGESVVDSDSYLNDNSSSQTKPNIDNDSGPQDENVSEEVQDTEPEQDDQQQGGNDSGGVDQNDQSSSGTEESPVDEEEAKEGGRAIEEEVDRMTQPSSGVAFQQEKPFDYRDTVQFDDTLPTNSQSREAAQNSKLPGSLIARFAAPNPDPKPQPMSKTSPTKDLQFDHNNRVAVSHKFLARKPKLLDKDKQEDKIDMKADEKVDNRRGVLGKARRQRRSAPVNLITNTREIGNFLDSIDFDGYIDRNSDAHQSPRARGFRTSYVMSIYEVPRINEPHDEIEAESSFPAQSEAHPMVQAGGSELARLLGASNHSKPMTKQSVSNETALHQFLDKKEFLEALKKSQLPAPSFNNITDDPRPSSSLNHLDLDQILDASSYEDKPKYRKSQKSSSKKKKHHEKMSGAKEMSLGFDRGGHRKKKQDKEEKKYLKEKKFKGAKKGKKVSKGRGGAGGKKGKKLYKDRGYKKKGFKNVAHKEEWGHKKSYFDEFRDKDFKKKWKKFDDKYNYAQMKKFQAKDEKGAKKLKHQDAKFKKFDNGKWKKSYQNHSKENNESSKRKKEKKSNEYD